MQDKDAAEPYDGWMVYAHVQVPQALQRYSSAECPLAQILPMEGLC